MFVKQSIDLNPISDFLEELGLVFPSQFTINLRQDWGGGEVGVAAITTSNNNLSPADLRKIKRLFGNLEVPSWARDYDSRSKPLQGTTKIGDWKVTIEISEALACTVVGEKEVEPTSYDVEKATKLATLTDEQRIFLMRLAEAKLLQPTKRPIYDCKPAGNEGVF